MRPQHLLVQSHAPCVIAAILVPSHATFIMATAIATTESDDEHVAQSFTTTNTATTGILNAMAAAHISPTETTPFHF
ncbi:hypothetical protein B5807_08667 [Epicoccum nigrum]|uniref:Uncharacterized protein n=1 Tax=Epicoccum nigrum TaxID=105696 RepID=A0A1Y2LU21_EPING|nr:hypothetical protein B5807_08667 [Epicoccum nigrum]